MRLYSLLRLAFGGSMTDRVRAGITVFAAMLAGLSLLALATVLNMAPTPPGGSRYTTTLLNDMGLRPGVIVMAAATIIPVLVLVAQAARLGGPARDRRLAAMRVAGATPRQCRAIAATEQGIAVGLGAILAMGAYPLLRSMLHKPTTQGQRILGPLDEDLPFTGSLLPLPTDTAPAWWGWPLVLLGLPVLAAALSAYALRRMVNDPLTSARRARRVRPRLWPVWLIPAGLALMALSRTWADRQAFKGASQALPYLTMTAGFAAVCLGVPLCAAGIGYLAAKLALRFGRRPATLIAARRVLNDPYEGSRAVATLLVCTVIIVALAGIRLAFRFTNEVSAQYGIRFGDDRLTDLVMNLLTGLSLLLLGFAAVGLLIALVDAALTRRRTEAALRACGTPDATLTRSRIGLVLLTAVPGVLLGVTVGYTAPLLAIPPAQQPASVRHVCHVLDEGEDRVVPCAPERLAAQLSVERREAGSAAYSRVAFDAQGPWHAVYPPVPWPALALHGGIALAVTILATMLSLLAGRGSPAATALRTT